MSTSVLLAHPASHGRPSSIPAWGSVHRDKPIPQVGNFCLAGAAYVESTPPYATIAAHELRAAAPAEGASVLILGLHLHIHLLHHVKGPAIDYLAVALASFASWVGLPGPGEPVLIAAGVFAAKHKLDITPVVLVAFAAASFGGVVGWLAGMFAGRSILTAPGPLRKMRLKAAARGEEMFKRVEVVAILLTPSWVAGINRSGAGVYLLTNAASAIVWALVFGLGAYYAGPPILELAGDFGVAVSVGIVVLVVGLVGAEVTRRRRRRARAQRGRSGGLSADG
jgi:membrane protein DedA with SNARE-associated domain